MTPLPKILIIDDEPIIRVTLESLLAADDLEILFAENGQKGLKMAQEHLPDAILLDVMMPIMDGYETCRQIRANPALAEIPVFMITALDDRNARLVGLLAGADDFLTKPFDGFELQVRIKNIMRINRFRNLLAERSRFNWVVENAEKGYVLLDDAGKILYANQRAQLYLHLPGSYTGLGYRQQAERHYTIHQTENRPEKAENVESVTYLVQPESSTARAFWLRVDTLVSSHIVENQHLLCISDVTDEMNTFHDIRKVHLLVAHKLRTPVALIYSNMDLLDSKMDLIPVDEVKAMVKTAWQGSARLVHEVREILKYIDAPLALSEGTPISIGNTCQVVRAAAGILEMENIQIRQGDFSGDEMLAISSNAMELIVHEILENSQKFHPNNSPQIEVEFFSHTAKMVQIRFYDNGHGMTAEQIARAFRPYHQGEKWFTGETPGLGLGLSLIASLVWQSGGNIRISNRENEGICILLELPTLQESNQEREQ